MDISLEEFVSRYLQRAAIHTPWYLAFHCISIREKELQKNGFALGLVKSAETCRVIIPPNGMVTIDGSVDKKIPFHRITVMFHQSSRACVPADVDLEATLHP